MKPRLVAAVGVLAAFALLVVYSARADAAEGPPPATVSLDSPTIRGAEAVADGYWAARGVTVPPLVGVYRLPAEGDWDGVDGYGEPDGGRVWIGADVTYSLHSSVRSFNVRSRAALCYLLIHERGHNAGLLHTDAATFPIMSMSTEVAGSGWLRQEVAPRCWTWARRPFG